MPPPNKSSSRKPEDPAPGPSRERLRRLLGKAEFQKAFEEWLARIRETVAPAGGPAEDGPWALVGIKRRGAILARRLWKELSVASPSLLYGEVDISLYRDDYHLHASKPQVLGTEISFGVDGVSVLLVDDVLFTGRTVRAAMELILDFGRPRVISLACFVDRGHRELPIAANIVGKEIQTKREDEVRVRLAELGEEDGVEVILGGSR
jgi:pyrimidine operon attenuation protein/uracil phosphoribosyltransferase